MHIIVPSTARRSAESRLPLVPTSALHTRPDTVHSCGEKSTLIAAQGAEEGGSNDPSAKQFDCLCQLRCERPCSTHDNITPCYEDARAVHIDDGRGGVGELRNIGMGAAQPILGFVFMCGSAFTEWH